MAKKAKGRSAPKVDLLKLINKKAGRNVAHSLKDENRNKVKQWTPTGSRRPDTSVRHGKKTR